MRCPDCGGKKYRRNMDRRKRELERRTSYGGFGGFQAEVQLLRFKMRSEEIPVDYVRRAAALGDARAQALGLKPWDLTLSNIGPVGDTSYYPFMIGILRGLPKTLMVSFAADSAERVLYIFEDAVPGDTRPRDAIAAARRWMEDPSGENEDAADYAADYAADSASSLMTAGTADAYAYEDAWAASSSFHSGGPGAAFSAAEAAAAAAYPSHQFKTAAAAWRAARATDEESERSWQKQRLIKYLLGEIEI